MTRFVRAGRVEHANVWVAVGYLAVAIVIGLKGADAGARLFGDQISPVSSASATAILASIASGMMALTAIVFSLVLVSVQLGGTSYSPRLVQVLGRKTFAGHILGIFSGTFLYSLLAIRAVDLGGRPGINVSVVIIALVWLLASIGALVALLPRVRSVVISDVLASLHDAAAAAAHRVYPGEHAPSPNVVPPDLPTTQILRHEGRPMYLIGLDVPRLVRAAAEVGAVISISPAIGDAIITGDRVVIVLGASRPLAEHRLHAALWLAPERRLDNDPAYAIRLLVDIAIRALSPAVNDPTTAVFVLDELDGLLRLIGSRNLEDHQHLDDRGALRLVRTTPSWDDLVSLALTEIHQYGRDSFQVQRRLATLLHDLSELLPERRRAALGRFGRWRAASVTELVGAADAWVDASAYDRQGLGHQLSALEHAPPHRDPPGAPSRGTTVAAPPIGRR